MLAQMIGDFKQQANVAAAIVGADEGGVLERKVGVVVAGQDDDAIFLAGELGDDVVHRKGTGGGFHVELILLDLRAF